MSPQPEFAPRRVAGPPHPDSEVAQLRKKPLIRVEFLQAIASEKFSFKPGQKEHINEAVALKWMDSEVCRMIGDEEPAYASQALAILNTSKPDMNAVRELLLKASKSKSDLNN